jgi:hypothetical protein
MDRKAHLAGADPRLRIIESRDWARTGPERPARKLTVMAQEALGRSRMTYRFDDSRADAAFVGLPRAEKSAKMRSRGATEGGRASKMLGQSRLKGYLGQNPSKRWPVGG